MAVVLGGGNGIYLASFGGPPPPALDPDAVAFLTAAGITDSTIEGAINTLVVDMKDAGIWTKMKAVYPFVGSTASTHKWNLINPLDTDAAFRLVFNGGWTHSSTGALPNGTNAYANTYLNVNSILNSNSHAFNFYLNSDNDGTVRGTLGANVTSNNTLDSYNFSSGVYYRSGSVGNIGAPLNNGKGFFGLTRRNSSSFDMLKQDGTYVLANVPTYTSINKEIWIGRINASSSYSIQSQAYLSISDGLTRAEMTSLRTAVETFQTTLSRNV
jgi:hypothetical protein